LIRYDTEEIRLDNYHIESLNDKNAAKWEEFNINSEEGTFFHSLKWKQILENTLNYKTQYFLLFKNNNVFGIFPFAEHKIHSFKGLFPFQFSGHNNIIIQDFNDPSAIEHIIKELPKLMRAKKKISFIGFASLHKETIDNIKNYSVPVSDNPGNMVLDLRRSPPEKIWENFTAKRGQRRFIRRFDETGFCTTEINSYDDLKLFYKYYSENINFIQGIPCTFSHFTDLRDNLSSDEIRITLLSKDTTVAGGMLMFPFKPKKTVYFEYLSLNRNLPTTYHPTYHLMWEAINWAWNNNYEKISFGAQTSDENNPRYRIKKGFGADFEPIYSKIIPMTRTFTIGCRGKEFFDRLHFNTSS
jgi:hypothetical protein